LREIKREREREEGGITDYRLNENIEFYYLAILSLI
jgi:hypothetical protein